MKLAVAAVLCLCVVAFVNAAPERRGQRRGPPTGKGGPVRPLAGLCKALEMNKTEEIPAGWEVVVGELQTDTCTPLFAVLPEKNNDADNDEFPCRPNRAARRGGRRERPGRRGGNTDTDNAVEKVEEMECPLVQVDKALTKLCDILDKLPTADPEKANQDVFNILLGMDDICDQVDTLNAA